ncbi:hypothetical protein NDA16_001325 [Ustilago loliicola]|nr:hypothetical protein NDA16_001325 [Ustilago loliicola]
MSHPEASSSTATSDPQTPKVKAQQQDKAAENKLKAQQNRERAAQNRGQKNVRFNEDKPGSSSKTSPPSAPAARNIGAKQHKKAAKRDVPAKSATARSSPGKAQTQFKSKVVIRRLPPNLPEEVFWKAVTPWIRDPADCQAAAPSAEASAEGAGEASTSATPTSLTPTVDYKSFIPGKLKSDTNKQNKHARAYVRFLDPTSLVTFHKNFDGHIFRDAKGKESVAIVEFAPYQKVVVPPTARGRKSKPDAKQGTIEKDADYLAFVERLNKVEGEGVKRTEGDLLASLWDPKEKIREREEQAEKGKMTPLLEHLRAVKMAKKESAAAAKKAKRAAKKGAAKGVGPVAAKVNEKGKAVETGAAGPLDVKAEIEGGVKAGKKEKRFRKGKGNAEGVDATTVAEGIAIKKPGNTSKPVGQNAQQGAGSTAKQPPKPPNKHNQGAATQGKNKPKPPPSSQRKKGGHKDKASAAATTLASPTPAFAPAPSKVQLLKRES